MKKAVLFPVFIFFCIISIAQVPEYFNYQAIVRDADQQPIVTQTVSFLFTVFKTSPTGTNVYSEKHTPTTNDQGLVTITIGNGNEKTGSFTSINWAADKYFLNVKTDPAGGTNYTDMGTTQLISVPYAMHSKTAEGITIADQSAGDMLYFDGTNWIRVPKGIPGQILTINETYTPSWANVTIFPEALAPVATIQQASNILLDSATLNGIVNAKGFTTNIEFEYGKTTEYGSLVSAIPNPIAGSTNTTVSAIITNLTHSTEYHFRLKIWNVAGITYSDDMTFYTKFPDPYEDPEDVWEFTGDLIRSWFMKTQDYNGPALMLWVGADAGTCSHENVAMRDFSYEPRIAWDNTIDYEHAVTTLSFYTELDSILASANGILKKVELGDMIFTGDNEHANTKMVQAIAHLAQGLSLGYLGLFFDQAFIETEYTDPNNPPSPSPYIDVIDSAVLSLDRCIAICESETFTLPVSWIPGMTYTQVEISQLANCIAARLISYSPRNMTENTSVDWSKVLSYANKGLTYDFAPLMDDIYWYDLYHTYANFSGWGQTDMRIINMMDPDMPARWVDATTWDILPDPTTSHELGVDDRIFTDFQYLSSCGFRVERGYYHFSCYRFSRHDTYLSTWTGPSPIIRKAENDLLKAEALYHTGDLESAKNIINNGTRISRGGLEPLGASISEIQDAIFHERNIELFCTGMGLEFFTMRKADKLQAGTPLHLPLPGKVLKDKSMDYYTFGSDQGVLGEDVSSGGWFKK